MLLIHIMPQQQLQQQQNLKKIIKFNNTRQG